MSSFLLAPSLLACDAGIIAQQMREAEDGGADCFHLDVMDGHFVPNLSYGATVCRDLKRHTKLPIDVHLMVTHPANHIPAFAEAGADSIVFHIEAENNPVDCLETIRAAGIPAGLSVKPKTALEVLTPYLPLCDIVLLMSVEPGAGGQAFLPESLDRLRALRRLVGDHHCELQIDGGVTLDNAKSIVDAGADLLVAGSSVFGADDITARCQTFRRI